MCEKECRNGKEIVERSRCSWGRRARSAVSVAAMAWVAATGFTEPQVQIDEPFRRGVELFNQGKDLEALQVFRSVAFLAPENAYVHYNIGMILEKLGLSTEALEAFRKAANLAPEEQEILLALGESLYWASRLEEAAAILEKAAGPPPLPEALEILAAVEQAQGATDKATSTLKHYIELRPEDLDARLLLGEQLAGAKRYEEAITVWKAGLTVNNVPPDLFFRIGEGLSRNSEERGEAVRYLRKALEVDSQHEPARLLLGRILARQGHLEESLAELQQIANDHPRSPQVHFALADIYRRLGRAAEAGEAQRRFRSLEKDAQESDRRRARIMVSATTAHELLEQGKVQEARAEFESILELDPESAEAHATLAKIAYSSGNLNEAQRHITRAINQETTVGEYHFLAGLFAARTGKGEEAESKLRRALELDPAIPDAWSLLGVLAADESRHAEAVGCFLKEASLSPSNPSVQLNLSAAYRALGKTVEAEEAMERYRALLAAGESKR